VNSQDSERIERYVYETLAPIKAEVADVKVAIKAEAEAHQVLHAWFALLADPKAAAKRLADIEAAATKAAKPQAKPDADRKAHDEAIVKEHAELEDLRTKVMKQRAEHAAEIAEIRHWKPIIIEHGERENVARLRAESPDLSGTLVREPGWRGSRRQQTRPGLRENLNRNLLATGNELMSNAATATPGSAPAGSQDSPQGGNAAPRTDTISDAHYDGLATADRDRYACVRLPDGGSEWRDRDTLPSAKGDGATPSADAIDPSKAQPGQRFKFVGADGGEFELDGQQILDLLAHRASEEARKAKVPADPALYKLELPKDFKVPAGVEIKLNPDLPEAIDLARWCHRNGLPQEAYSEIAAIYTITLAREAASIHSARNAEINKLGAKGVARVQAVETFLDAAGVPELKGRIFTSADVGAFERLIDRVVRQGSAPMPMGKREAPEVAGRASAAEYDKMTPGERYNYSRQFPQKGMPAWRDPRG
jgi:hypothetical protein